MSRTVEMPNAQQLAGVWSQVKGRVREKWGQLTDDDLEQAKGNVDQLIGIVQRKAGLGRAEVESFLTDSYEAASGVAGKVREMAGEFSSRAAESVQEQYQNVTNKLGEASSEAQEFVRNRPAESIGIAFGAGVLSGVLLTLLMRSR
jgi:uncharacterized protein YjbJ (UPF0337 family)